VNAQDRPRLWAEFRLLLGILTQQFGGVWANVQTYGPAPLSSHQRKLYRVCQKCVTWLNTLTENPY
jgi:hypothetical protein